MINCKELGDRIWSLCLSFSASRKKPNGTIDNPYKTYEEAFDACSDGSDGKPGRMIYVKPSREAWDRMIIECMENPTLAPDAPGGLMMGLDVAKGDPK